MSAEAPHQYVPFAELSGNESYQWMTKLVVPRPIGWVVSKNENGSHNLAPFSWFQNVGAKPPIFVLGCAKRKVDGELVEKDTTRNILRERECTVHLVEREQAAVMNESSAEDSPEASEVERLGLELVEGKQIATPSLACCRVAIECELVEVVQRPGWMTAVILLEGVGIRISPTLLGEDGVIDKDWRPIARLGGEKYGSVEAAFLMERPRLR